jgi:hypothetical protein
MIMESHIGVVMTVDKDPDKEFGIECLVDSVLQDEIYPAIFKPIFPPNRIAVPEVGQQVEVLIPGDEDGFPGESDIGTSDFTEFVFYTGRIFDQVDGSVPKDLLTNYPKRAGLLWNVDGTVIYYDSTKKKKEFTIKLTDGKTFITLKEDEISITQDQVNIQLKGQEITFTGKAKLGGSSAAEELLKGTTVHQAISDLVTAWLIAASALATAPDPSGAAAQAYGTAMNTAVTTLQTTLGTWKSTKHTLDS